MTYVLHTYHILQYLQQNLIQGFLRVYIEYLVDETSNHMAEDLTIYDTSGGNGDNAVRCMSANTNLKQW